MPPYDELKTLLTQLFSGVSTWRDQRKHEFIEAMIPLINISKKPVEDVIQKVRDLIIERYYKANKESIILLSKKLGSDLIREYLDDLMIAAAKEHIKVLQLREKERLDNEKKEKAEFERQKEEVENQRKINEDKQTELIERE